MKMPKAIFCWSGGKDSAYCLHKVLSEQSYEICYLLTTISGEYKRISMHGVRENLLEKQAEAIGIQLIKVSVSEGTNEEYERQMEIILLKAKAEGISHVIYGDIFLEDIKEYREKNLEKVNMQGVFPLWKTDTKWLVNDFITQGFKTITCCVSDEFLNEEWVGKEIDTAFVSQLPPAVDPCGENGEFHTFCFDGPLFKTKINFSIGEKIYKPLEVKTTDFEPLSNVKGFWFCDLIPVENKSDKNTMNPFNVEPVNFSIQPQLQDKIDLKTKPTGALGRLEELALQIGLIQGTSSPVLKNPHIIVFAGDHGVVEENISAYPQEVTYQMVYNFLSGGAAINVFCKQHGINIKVVDAGVKHTFEPHADLIVSKAGEGTNNFAHGPAMSLKQADECLLRGAALAENIYLAGCNIIGFGEMGIGNTTSASALMHVFTGIDLPECVGKGTGIDTESISHKAEVIRKAVVVNAGCETPMKKLAAFGGFEIAQMTGAMLKAAELKMVIMIDGFIATSAFLVANNIDSSVFDYAIFCHQSEERGHRLMLEFLRARPLMSLNMRLGEGTGCAVAFPIIQSAVAFLNEMASFESAGISNKDEA